MDFSDALGILQRRAEPSAVSQCVECSGEAGGAIPLPPPPSHGALHPLPLPTLLRQLLDCQEERVCTYRYFEEGFARFLQCAEAEGYDLLTQSATARFSQISHAINLLGESLEKHAAPSAGALAASVRRLQSLEKQKLSLTAQHHILRHG